MQVCISTRDCRAAVGATIVALEAKIKDDTERLKTEAYNRLLDGAQHNGVPVNDALKQEMREMAQRDTDHMMHRHPGHETMEVLKNYIDLLAYHKGDLVNLDDQDFALLKEHLPKAPPAEIAA